MLVLRGKNGLLAVICCLLAVARPAAQDPAAILQSRLTDGQKADSLLACTRVYFLKARFDSVNYCFRAGYPLALSSGQPATIAGFYVMDANMDYILGRSRQALPKLDKAAPYISDATPYELAASYLLTRANCYGVTSNKDSALHYFQAAEEYSSRHNPYRNWAVFLAKGQFYMNSSEYEEAELSFNKAYAITRKNSESIDHGYVLTLFLNLYTAWNKPEKATGLMQEYDAHMSRRRKANVKDPVQRLMNQYAGSQIENNINFLQAMRQASLADGHVNQRMLANSYIAAYYEARGKFREALPYVLENEQLAREKGDLQQEYQARLMHYGLVKKTGEVNEALSLSDTLMALRDTLLSAQRREQLLEMERKYEAEKKQREIALLSSQTRLDEKTIALLTADKRLAALLLVQEAEKRGALERENMLMDSIVRSEQAYSLAVTNEKEKQQALNAALDRENQLKASQLRKERNSNRVLAAGALLLLLAGAAIMWLYRKQRAKNAIIQRQAAELEVLMKEIHHRVKNNLQIVSGLLDLQGHYITNEQASEAVREGRSRVQSMALIHQNLYQEGNIRGIRLKEYMDNLLQMLTDSYQITRDKVRISSQIDDLNLDVDTLIPVGLVMNELVSNAFKYAFRHKPEGELSIWLREQDGRLLLRVKDNGPGFPENFDWKSSPSFGLKMIRAFAQKLKGRLNMYNSEGAVVEMEINKFKKA